MEDNTGCHHFDSGFHNNKYLFIYCNYNNLRYPRTLLFAFALRIVKRQHNFLVRSFVQMK